MATDGIWCALPTEAFLSLTGLTWFLACCAEEGNFEDNKPFGSGKSFGGFETH